MPAGGEQSNFGQGSLGNSVSARLRSRKDDGGSASIDLSGQQIGLFQGAISRSNDQVLSGSSSTSITGNVSIPSPGGSLTPSPPLYWEPRMNSDANILADFKNPSIFSNGTPNGHSYVNWSAYGLSAIRLASGWTGGSGIDEDKRTLAGIYWRKYLRHATRDIFADTGAQNSGAVFEAWCLYGILIDSNVAAGMTAEGVKLPGFEGPNADPWSVKMEFRAPGVEGAPPGQFRLTGYWYGPSWQGGAPFGEIVDMGATYLAPETVYFIRQHVKLNTFTSGVANSDGVMEVWLGSTLLYSRSNIKFRSIETNPNHGGLPSDICQFWPNVYHGGLDVPSAQFHVEVGAIAVSTFGQIPLPTATTLAAAAGAMSPGTWTTLSTPLDMGGVLTRDGASETTYSNEATWDQFTKKVNFLTKRTSGYPIQQVQYSAAAHSWSVFNADCEPPLGEFGHAYDYNVQDPTKRRLFFKRHPSFDGLSHRIVYFADPPTYFWSTINKFALWPDAGGGDVVAQPAFFWSGTMTGVGTESGFSPEGALVLCVLGSTGTVHFVRYDIETASWDTSVTFSRTGITTAEKWGAYSATHNCAVVILLDNIGPIAVRLNSGGTATLLTTPPKGAGAHSFTPPHAGLFTCDPVTGNFLLLNTDGSFYELDPTGVGTWTQLTGSALPPTSIYPYQTKHAVCVPIPEYGVVMFFCNGADGVFMHLYKHQ